MISKKQLDYICIIWKQCYGENLKAEYQKFYKHLKRDSKLKHLKNLEEGNYG